MTGKDRSEAKDKVTVFSRPIAMLTLGGLFAANAVSLDGPIVAIPEIASQFGVSAGEAQLVTVLFLLGFALGHIPMGLLSDRLGRKPIIIGGLVIAGLMSVIAVIAPTFEILLAARFCQGIATCAASMLARAMVRDVAKGEQASRLNSNALSCLAVLIFIAPILSGYLLNISGWRSVLGALSFYILLLLLLTLFFVPETMHTEKRSNSPWQQFLGSLKDFISSKQAIFASLLGGIAFATYFIFANIGASMVVDTYDLPASNFGIIFALTAIVQFFASMANSRIVEKRGSHFVLRMAIGSCLAAIAMCLFWFFVGTPSLTAMVLIALCFAITHGLVLPNSIALALDPLPKTAGFAAAIHGMLQTGIAALIGFIISGLYDGQIKTILIMFMTFGTLTLVIFFMGRDMLKSMPPKV